MTAPTRRDVLAATGAGLAAVVAGCNALDDEEERQRFEPNQLDAILTPDAPDVASPAPVQPTREAVDDALARVDALLDRVPSDVDEDDVPNGVVRREIGRTRESAVRGRERVGEAPDRFHALRETHRTRRYAREASAAYRGVDGEVTFDGIRDERETVASDVGARRASLEYVGDDDARTLLLTYRLERDLVAAANYADREVHAPEPSVLDLGELAGAVESATASLATATHLARRHDDRLADPTDFEDRFDRALDRSVAAAAERDLATPRDDPSDLVEDDVSGTPAESLLREATIVLYRADDGLRDHRAEDRLASGLRAAYALERDVRAFESVRAAVAAGEHRSIEDVEDVRAVRADALDAAESAPVDADDASLGGDLLADGLQSVSRVDRNVDRHVEDEYPVSLRREYARYVWLGAQFEAFGAATEAFRDRLRES